GCSMVRVDNPNTAANVSGAECKQWEDAAINWVNQQNPAVVIVSGGPDLNSDWKPNGKALTSAELTTGYAAALKELQGPGRKLFLIGTVPHMKEDPPRCLAAHDTSALECAAPPAE